MSFEQRHPSNSQSPLPINPPLLLRCRRRRRYPPTDEEKVRVHLMLRIADLLLHLRHHDLALLERPAEHAREEAHGVRIDAVADVLALEDAELLVALAFGPGADGDLSCVSRVAKRERRE